MDKRTKEMVYYLKNYIELRKEKSDRQSMMNKLCNYLAGIREYSDLEGIGYLKLSTTSLVLKYKMAAYSYMSRGDQQLITRHKILDK